MSTENFIDSIISGNAADSNTAFKDLLNAKIADALSSRKIELANSVYNGIEEIQDEVPGTETETDGSEQPADQEV